MSLNHQQALILRQESIMRQNSFVKTTRFLVMIALLFVASVTTQADPYSPLAIDADSTARTIELDVEDKTRQDHVRFHCASICLKLTPNHWRSSCSAMVWVAPTEAMFTWAITGRDAAMWRSSFSISCVLSNVCQKQGGFSESRVT